MNIVITNKAKHFFWLSVDYTGVLCKLEPISATYATKLFEAHVFLCLSYLSNAYDCAHRLLTGAGGEDQ